MSTLFKPPLIASTLFLVCGGLFTLRAEIRLPSVYSSNMVFQQGVDSAIYGYATPKAKVSGTFRGKRFDSTIVNSQGEWRLSLSRSYLKETSLSTLEMTEESKNHQGSKVVLTNVAVGRVWWLGVLDGCGMPATDAAIVNITNTSRDRIRFTDMNGGPWMSLARLTSPTNRLHAFALAAARNLVGDGYVGIVQITPAIVLRFESDVTPVRDGSDRLQQVNAWLDTARANVNREVSALRGRNQELLIYYKHEGVVTNLPLPCDYSISTVRLRESFKIDASDSDFQKLFNNYKFEGVIW